MEFLFQWFPLEGCKHGDLRLKVHWMNLTPEVRDLEKQEWESEWIKSDKPLHPALLMVFVDNASDLPVRRLLFFHSFLRYLEEIDEY